MRKLLCALLIMLVVIMIFTGCASQSNVKSDEEASKTVSELGQDIGGVGATLDDIDKGLGGEVKK